MSLDPVVSSDRGTHRFHQSVHKVGVALRGVIGIIELAV